VEKIIEKAQKETGLEDKIAELNNLWRQVKKEVEKTPGNIATYKDRVYAIMTKVMRADRPKYKDLLEQLVKEFDDLTENRLSKRYNILKATKKRLVDVYRFFTAPKSLLGEKKEGQVTLEPVVEATTVAENLDKTIEIVKTILSVISGLSDDLTLLGMSIRDIEDQIGPSQVPVDLPAATTAQRKNSFKFKAGDKAIFLGKGYDFIDKGDPLVIVKQHSASSYEALPDEEDAAETYVPFVIPAKLLKPLEPAETKPLEISKEKLAMKKKAQERFLDMVVGQSDLMDVKTLQDILSDEGVDIKEGSTFSVGPAKFLITKVAGDFAHFKRTAEIDINKSYQGQKVQELRDRINREAKEQEKTSFSGPGATVPKFSRRSAQKKMQKIVMSGLLLDTADHYKQLEEGFKNMGFAPPKVIGQFKTLPGQGGPGGRNDVVLAVDSKDVPKLAISPFHLSGGFSWAEDYLANNAKIIPPEARKLFQENPVTDMEISNDKLALMRREEMDLRKAILELWDKKIIDNRKAEQLKRAAKLAPVATGKRILAIAKGKIEGEEFRKIEAYNRTVNEVVEPFLKAVTEIEGEQVNPEGVEPPKEHGDTRKIAQLDEVENLEEENPTRSQCIPGHCRTQDVYWRGGDEGVYQKLREGTCPVCDQALDKAYGRSKTEEVREGMEKESQSCKKRYVNADGSFKGGFEGCEKYFRSKCGGSKSAEAAAKLCAYIKRRKHGIKEAELLADFLEPTFLTVDQVREVCASCADKMEKRGMTKIEKSVFERSLKKAQNKDLTHRLKQDYIDQDLIDAAVDWLDDADGAEIVKAFSPQFLHGRTFKDIDDIVDEIENMDGAEIVRALRPEFLQRLLAEKSSTNASRKAQTTIPASENVSGGIKNEPPQLEPPIEHGVRSDVEGKIDTKDLGLVFDTPSTEIVASKKCAKCGMVMEGNTCEGCKMRHASILDLLSDRKKAEKTEAQMSFAPDSDSLNPSVDHGVTKVETGNQSSNISGGIKNEPPTKLEPPIDHGVKSDTSGKVSTTDVATIESESAVTAQAENPVSDKNPAHDYSKEYQEKMLADTPKDTTQEERDKELAKKASLSIVDLFDKKVGQAGEYPYQDVPEGPLGEPDFTGEDKNVVMTPALERSESSGTPNDPSRSAELIMRRVRDRTYLNVKEGYAQYIANSFPFPSDTSEAEKEAIKAELAKLGYSV